VGWGGVGALCTKKQELDRIFFSYVLKKLAFGRILREGVCVSDRSRGGGQTPPLNACMFKVSHTGGIRYNYLTLKDPRKRTNSNFLHVKINKGYKKTEMTYQS
jgi:hypothetical protein